jgi:abortive infection bacteriophage resistance protein
MLRSDAHQGRVFFAKIGFSGMDRIPKTIFNKPWLNCKDQIALLRSRGLILKDDERAEAILKHINYYRFSAYCIPFESERHKFRSDVTFDQILQTYLFDKQLRLILAEALAFIEVDLRANIAYEFGQIYGSFAHISPRIPLWVVTLV